MQLCAYTIFISKRYLIHWFSATIGCGIKEWGRRPFRKRSRFSSAPVFGNLWLKNYLRHSRLDLFLSFSHSRMEGRTVIQLLKEELLMTNGKHFSCMRMRLTRKAKNEGRISVRLRKSSKWRLRKENRFFWWNGLGFHHPKIRGSPKKISARVHVSSLTVWLFGE